MIDETSLKFVKQAKFLRNCPVMYLTDMPLQNEADKGEGYSSQKARQDFEVLQKAGILRGAIHATYVFNFRPEGGEASAIFWRKELPIDGYVSWGTEKNIFILDYAYNELKRLRDEIALTKPRIIICSGKWALYFLTGETKQKETAKSPFGTLMKWRASSLQLSDWWNYSEECIVMPILPLNSKWQLPDCQYLISWDMQRIMKIVANISAGKSIAEFAKREENFIVPTQSIATLEIFSTVKQTLITLLERAETSEGIVKLAIDVETSSYAYIDCIGIAWSATEAICIPFATKESPHFWSELQEVEIYSLLYALLLHKNVGHIGQNYSYDMQYFWRNLALKVQPLQDTMIMNHVLFSTMDKNLGFLSSLYCKVHKWWKDEGKTSKGASNIERWVYNVRDCCATFEIAKQEEIIYSKASESLQGALAFQTDKVLPAITNVMNRGIRLDTLTRDSQIIDLQHAAQQIEHQFNEALGETVNLNSPAQCKELFYELFKCKKTWKRVTSDNGETKNVLTLDEETLKDLWETELLVRPFIDLLLDHKKLTKTAGGLKGLTLDTDGRLRCSYNICGTDTYRFSSNSNAFGTGTNLQVISKGKKLRNGSPLPNSKKLFLPDPGYEYFDIDLSSADARIVAARSGCQEMMDILEAGEDLYTMLAREYYKDKTIEKADARRDLFKRGTHATNYIGSAPTIAARTGLLVIDVERLQRYYFGRFPEIPAWHKELRMLVHSKQKITNIFGFQRWFFDLSLPTLMQVAAAWEPQSTVAILINKGLIAIEQNYPEVQVLMQTHDSLGGQLPIGREDLKQGIISSCMIELPYARPITIPVDIRTSEKSWGDC